MVVKRRRFTREFKLQVVREVESGKSVAQVAREYQLHPTMINRWRKEHERYAEQAFSGNGNSLKSETRVAELERMVGRMAMELEMAKKVSSFLNSSRKTSGSG